MKETQKNWALTEAKYTCASPTGGKFFSITDELDTPENGQKYSI